MIYYKVKAEHDNKARFKYYEKNGFSYYVKEDGILIGNELYTPKEREKIANNDRYFEKVEISKNKTYWFFGARFEQK